MADGTTINIESQSTDFARGGTTQQQISYQPAGGPSILQVLGSVPLVTKPTFSATSLVAMAQLAGLYALGPFDVAFEAQTLALYTRQYSIARAAAQSGPTNVRGGTARQAFELAELGVRQAINQFREIWNVQVAWANVVIAAVKEHNTFLTEQSRQQLADNEQSVMAQHANAQSALGFYGQVNDYNRVLISSFTASRHYGVQQMLTTEDLVGVGNQNGIQNGFGVSSLR